MQPATKYRITLFFPFSIRCRAFRMPFPLAKHIFQCIYSLQNVRRAFLTLYCYFTVQRTLCMLRNIAHVKFTSTPISIYFPTDFKWQHLHKYSQRSYIIVAYSRIFAPNDLSIYFLIALQKSIEPTTKNLLYRKYRKSQCKMGERRLKQSSHHIAFAYFNTYTLNNCIQFPLCK